MTDVVLERRTVGEPDALGLDTWTVEQTAYPDCLVWPGERAETLGDGDTVSTGLTVVLPPGTVVHPTDAVLVAGVRYEVDGLPWDWTGLSGWRPGVQVRLKRIDG